MHAHDGVNPASIDEGHVMLHLNVPLKPVMMNTPTTSKMPSTGPEKADRKRVPVWYSSHVLT